MEMILIPESLTRSTGILYHYALKKQLVFAFLLSALDLDIV